MNEGVSGGGGGEGRNGMEWNDNEWWLRREETDKNRERKVRERGKEGADVKEKKKITPFSLSFFLSFLSPPQKELWKILNDSCIISTSHK